MAAKIQKSSDLGKIWFPSRLWCCELISIVWEPCYDPSDHIISCYITPTVVGWCIVILRFFFTIIIIIILPHIFVHSISRRCLDQTLWNLVGMSYAMWSCAFKGLFFQNGCRCHGNDQNAKKLKNTKMIIAGYLPNRNWWNLIGTTSTSRSLMKGIQKCFLIPPFLFPWQLQQSLSNRFRVVWLISYH
jgi:hypothetical protein